MSLILTPNLPAHDAFYQTLIDTHQDLDDTQSRELNAALILILANHIGDRALLDQALVLARASVLRS